MVSAFFTEKGLVRQQLDSFNEFINTQMQEIVDEHGTLTIKPESQHNPGKPEETLFNFRFIFRDRSSVSHKFISRFRSSLNFTNLSSVTFKCHLETKGYSSTGMAQCLYCLRWVFCWVRRISEAHSLKFWSRDIRINRSVPWADHYSDCNLR